MLCQPFSKSFSSIAARNQATAINYEGEIVGYGDNPQDNLEGFLLTPVPEPSSLILFAVGTLALAWLPIHRSALSKPWMQVKSARAFRFVARHRNGFHDPFVDDAKSRIRLLPLVRSLES